MQEVEIFFMKKNVQVQSGREVEQRRSGGMRGGSARLGAKWATAYVRANLGQKGI